MNKQAWTQKYLDPTMTRSSHHQSVLSSSLLDLVDQRNCKVGAIQQNCKQCKFLCLDVFNLCSLREYIGIKFIRVVDQDPVIVRLSNVVHTLVTDLYVTLLKYLNKGIEDVLIDLDTCDKVKRGFTVFDRVFL